MFTPPTVSKDRLVRTGPREFGFSPLQPRLWHGMTIQSFLRLMRGNWGKVSFRRYPMALTVAFMAPGNSFYRWLGRRIWGRRIAATRIAPDPVFILGHWRSGTTWLHQMIANDPRHAAPSAAECFLPETYLVLRRLYGPLLAHVFPKRRPMDSVGINLKSAEEEEIALTIMGLHGDAPWIAFPCHVRLEPDGLARGLELCETSDWREGWLGFLRLVQYLNPGKRLILKSPLHTLRLKMITQLFPQARYIHIVRDPVSVMSSRRRSAKAMAACQSFQAHVPDQEFRDEQVIAGMAEFHELARQSLAHVPEDRIVTLKYEDLRADPEGTMERVYGALDLGSFEPARPAFAAFQETRRDYRTNAYEDRADLARELFARCPSVFTDHGYPPPDQGVS